MKKIYLHIGTFKTGSTAIQFHMHQNKERLLENGFYYGDYFDHYYLHSNLCYGLLEEALKAYGLFERYKDHPRFLNVAEKPDEVIERIRQHTEEVPNIILSCEAFFADAFRTLVGLYTGVSYQEKRAINAYMRRRLKELLFSISDQVVIICYLRRQDLYVESQYNQYCKNIWYGEQGRKLPEFEQFVKCEPVTLNYFTELQGWREVFDTAEFVVKPYEKKAFRVDLITDFYTDILGIDLLEAVKFADIDKNQANQRLSRDVLEYKKHLGIYNEKVNQLLIEYCGTLERVLDYAYFSKMEREKFVEQYKEQNEKVAINYLHRSNGRLFDDMDYNLLPYHGLEMETVYEITRWLICNLH